MDSKHAELLERLEQFAIDANGVKLTFADRLARENGWSRPFARRVVEEYKRFVFMAMVAGHAVTPSDEVDEAWHLHLTYTRSYWNDLCRGVLGKPLHHIPTRGGPSERARHIEQYERTLATYQEFFGHSPPADIWPPTEVRFAENSHHVRVNRSDVWVIPKPRWPRHLVKGRSLFVGAIAGPLLIGAANPFDLAGPQFLVVFGVVSIVAVLAAYVMRQFLRDNMPIDDQKPLSPYEIACLGGGVPGVLRACLATLVVDSRLQLVPGEKTSSFKANGPAFKGDHDIERIMLRQASHENGATAAELLDAARPAAEEIQSSLRGRRLMESNESFAAARWAPFALLSLVCLVGLVKVFVGIQRDKPIVILIVMLFGLALAMVYFCRLPLRTRRGEELLSQLKGQHDRLKSLQLGSQAEMANASLSSNDLLLAAGLFGLASLHHPDVAALNKSLKPLSESGFSSSGCGASTGCGGGGGDGGGGCGGGGCGGCGGD